MRVAGYEINRASIVGVFRLLKSSLRYHLFGIPKIDEDSPEAIAKVILKRNCNEIIYAGGSNFRYEWVVDTGIAFRGLKKVLPKKKLSAIVGRILNESYAKGYVPCVFSKGSSYDTPYRRADNLPWLFYMLDELGELEDMEKRPKLKRLYENWIEENFDKHRAMVKTEVKGDWMDTILRPSSTYNNLCALKLFRLAERLGFKSYAKELEEALFKSRWTGSYFKDFEGSGDWISGDANAIALYFQLFDESIRNKIADALEASGLLEPIPIKVRPGYYEPELWGLLTALNPTYHSSAWLHIGLMVLNGFKALGRDYQRYKKSVDDAVMLYRNFLEVFDENGKPWHTPFHVTEWELTMAACQYLELVADKK